MLVNNLRQEGVMALIIGSNLSKKFRVSIEIYLVLLAVALNGKETSAMSEYRRYTPHSEEAVTGGSGEEEDVLRFVSFGSNYPSLTDDQRRFQMEVETERVRNLRKGRVHGNNNYKKKRRQRVGKKQRKNRRDRTTPFKVMNDQYYDNYLQQDKHFGYNSRSDLESDFESLFRDRKHHGKINKGNISNKMSQINEEKPRRRNIFAKRRKHTNKRSYMNDSSQYDKKFHRNGKQHRIHKHKLFPRRESSESFKNNSINKAKRSSRKKHVHSTEKHADSPSTSFSVPNRMAHSYIPPCRIPELEGFVLQEYHEDDFQKGFRATHKEHELAVNNRQKLEDVNNKNEEFDIKILNIPTSDTADHQSAPLNKGSTHNSSKVNKRNSLKFNFASASEREHELFPKDSKHHISRRVGATLTQGDSLHKNFEDLISERKHLIGGNRKRSGRKVHKSVIDLKGGKIQPLYGAADHQDHWNMRKSRTRRDEGEYSYL